MIITFPNYEILGKIITGERLKLLGMIRKHKPKSIQELAKIVDRDFKNVYQDVQLLSQYGLISLKSKGPRKASEIKALYSEIILAA
jgi:predicted transcriptional regulator